MAETKQFHFPDAAQLTQPEATREKHKQKEQVSIPAEYELLAAMAKDVADGIAIEKDFTQTSVDELQALTAVVDKMNLTDEAKVQWKAYLNAEVDHVSEGNGIDPSIEKYIVQLLSEGTLGKAKTMEALIQEAGQEEVARREAAAHDQERALTLGEYTQAFAQDESGKMRFSQESIEGLVGGDYDDMLSDPEFLADFAKVLPKTFQETKRVITGQVESGKISPRIADMLRSSMTGDYQRHERSLRQPSRRKEEVSPTMAASPEAAVFVNEDYEKSVEAFDAFAADIGNMKDAFKKGQYPAGDIVALNDRLFAYMTGNSDMDVAATEVIGSLRELQKVIDASYQPKDGFEQSQIDYIQSTIDHLSQRAEQLAA